MHPLTLRLGGWVDHVCMPGHLHVCPVCHRRNGFIEPLLPCRWVRGASGWPAGRAQPPPVAHRPCQDPFLSPPAVP